MTVLSDRRFWGGLVTGVVLMYVWRMYQAKKSAG